MVYTVQCNLLIILTDDFLDEYWNGNAGGKGYCWNIERENFDGSLADTAQKAMKDEKIESRLANDTRNTRYVFHCSPVVKHRRCRLLLINRNGNRSP